MERSQIYRASSNWRPTRVFTPFVLVVYLMSIFGVLAVNIARTFASDTSQTATFTNPADYTIDDGIEISGNQARLKAQNYATDANTAALYHMDEGSGAVASDASVNANDGTVTSGTFGVGNLNNALSLNSATSRVRVPDTASLSLTGSNTLEAWTKFNSSFSANSSAQRQGVVDKGDYQLYYDNETGKIVYELADKTANSWTQETGYDQNGGWDANGKRAVNSLVKMGSNFYAAIGIDTGDAEVWRYNGTTWTLIGGGPASVNGSWDQSTYEGVYTLATDGTNVFAGMGTGTGDADVWQWNGTTWAKIGGDAVNSSWPVSTYEQVWTLDYFGGKLYAGLGNTAGDAEVWSYSGGSWTKIGGDAVNSSWATSVYEMVASLTDDGTNLYAGLGASAGDGEVWKWNGTTWTKIGGDGINSGWDATIETVRTLKYLGGKLYAGLGDTAGDGDVWSWNGTAWTQIGGDGLNGSWAASTYEQIGSFAWDGTNLYAGTGTSNGDGEVWQWNGTAWTKIGGDAVSSSWTTAQGDTVNTMLYDGGTLYAGLLDAAGEGLAYTYNGSSWTIIGGGYVNKSWGFYGTSTAQVMQNVGNYLYVGTGNTAGAALVYRYDGTTWQIIGGQGVNGSWAPFTYEQVMSMASYNGKLYVGLGTTANDAEVWEWNGTTWTQVGGDSLNSGWTTNYEVVSAMASYGGYLYAGLGVSANDAEVWRYNGTAWSKIGGDSLNSGWTTNFETVTAMAIYNGNLVAGLGVSGGDGEVWQWNGTAWSKIGGDLVNSSWDTTSFEEVDALQVYNGKLYAGLGTGGGDGQLWEYNGVTWVLMGGNDVNSSWTTGTYERVRSLGVYNGDLYAGLGSSAGDSEVWRYDGTVWTKVGGNSVNDSWGNAVEEVEAFATYKGKLYVGNGNTANADGVVWSYGNNGYLESATASFDTSWHHIAASYDGSSMKLFIDGTQNASKPASLQLPDSTRALLLGSTYGIREIGKANGVFQGSLDEVRISNAARSSFTTKPYATTAQAISITDSIFNSGVSAFDAFPVTQTLDGATVKYRISTDSGNSWKYWDGSAWTVSNSYAEASDASAINSHMDSVPVTFYGLRWQSVLTSNGTQRPSIQSVGVGANLDGIAPSANASAVQGYKSNGGTSLASNAWTNGASPYFSWTAASDGGAGIAGYCLYLGQDNTADPITTKGLLGASPAYAANYCQFMTTGTSLDLSTPGLLNTALSTSTSPYYLLVKAIDKAGNLYPTTSEFHFRFDNVAPTNPGYITAPSGFINTKVTTLTWPTSGAQAAADTGSGLAGLQYKINGSSWYGDDHTGAGDAGDLLANDGNYTTVPHPDGDNINEGINTIYFRTWDQAGNITSGTVNAILKVNTAGAPSEPQNLTATPSTNTSNSFAFNWSAPATFVGDQGNLTYCYTINTVPTDSNCIFTSAGATSLGAGPYATQPGTNTLYLVARDESSNINYSSFSSVNFTANTPSPGIPTNADIVDVSIKSTSNWRLAITWDAPTYAGTGVSAYKVYRSTNNSTFTFVGSSSSTTYIDAGLQSVTYYYKVRACDSTNNCGAPSTVVSMLPTGKFTDPAAIISQPEVSNVTTKKATISWVTDRGSDSKIAIGTTSGTYGSSEIGNSTQTSLHTIQLDNLAAGTTYYYVAKWTDEDGNIGTSQEFTFTTAPAPTVKEVETLSIGLSNASIRFTSKGATKVNLYYGLSDSFGGLKSVNTSMEESQYTINLDGLNDGSKYFYRISSFDSEGGEYAGNILSFNTPPRPHITNLRFQPVPGEPTSTQEITWNTNVASTSVVTYGKVGSNGIDLQDSKQTTEHAMRINNLEDDSTYFIIAQGRDGAGNLAVSDRQQFRTALDTRAPKISDINIEASIRGTGAEARGQVVVSWKTDEPSTSQVAYAQGSNAVTFNSKTAEDGKLTTEHLVIVSDLPTSRVFSIQPVSRDKARNATGGEVQSAIVGRASESVLTIILNTMQKVFGF